MTDGHEAGAGRPWVYDRNRFELTSREALARVEAGEWVYDRAGFELLPNEV